MRRARCKETGQVKYGTQLAARRALAAHRQHYGPTHLPGHEPSACASCGFWHLAEAVPIGDRLAPAPTAAGVLDLALHRLSVPSTARQVAKVSGIDELGIYLVLERLEQRGQVQQVGRRQSGRGSDEIVWQRVA